MVAVLSLSILGPLFSQQASAGTTPPPPSTPKSFVARDATRFHENPNLAKYGLKNLEVVYEGSLWPAGASRDQPDLKYILKNYIPKARAKRLDVLVIDIETWPFTSTQTSAQITENIAKYKKVVNLFRRELPGVKLGLYGAVPQRNWLAACGDPKKIASRTASWHQRNMALQPLADAVDIIVPSLYTFYEDPKSVACWPAYAKANIDEAKFFGKPVWPFLWMKDHKAEAFLGSAFWRTQLETVYQHADGLVIWSMASSRDKWSYTAPWWLETVAFLKSKNLAPK